VAKRARRDRDDYPTKAREREILADLIRDRCPWLRAPRTLEPSAGRGAILQTLQEKGVCVPELCTAVELNRSYRPALQRVAAEVRCPEDFRFWRPPAGAEYDLIPGNPPFMLAAQIVSKCYDLLAPGGVLALLLRVGFLESEERLEWNQAHVPAGIAVLGHRPGFLEGSNSTDATTYAFLFWVKGPAQQWHTVV
jgi:hypothetical protein